MKKNFCLFATEFKNHFDGIKNLIETDSGSEFELHESLDDLKLLNCYRYDVLFIYINIKRCSDELFAIISDFLYSGGIIVAFHATFASFNNQDKFLDVFGAKFIRHGPVRRFRISPSVEIDPGYPGVSFEVTDELFRQRYSDSIRVVYSYIGRSVEEPVIWENSLGSGHLLGISVGHGADTLQNPVLVSIIRTFLGKHLDQQEI